MPDEEEEEELRRLIAAAIPTTEDAVAQSERDLADFVDELPERLRRWRAGCQ